MTGNFEILEDAEKCRSEAKIYLPTGHTSGITHKGLVSLENGLKLKDVLHVAVFKHNLLSIQKLVENELCKVDFHAHYCEIQDKKSGEIRGIGKAENGLYYLINDSMKSIGKKLAEMKKLSGKRLGHAPMTKIKKIEELKEIDNKCEDICMTCPAAKFTKLPYTLSSSRAKHALELIHIDIWGAFRVTNIYNQRYFLTIVDDYSRVTWVKLLKEKSQAFSAVEEFVCMGKTRYGKEVKTIISDNALEFDDASCREFFCKMGIIHQTSCVDRPQQNGRAERKNRNILEMARVLKIQAGVPLQYWGDSVQAVVYIIKRLIIPLLSHKSPYEVLTNTKPVYDHMKIFGCLAMASNLCRNVDKFSLRGVPCMFLGYPLNKKGYRLLNLAKNKIFVSRDVKFYESICPYKLFYPNNKFQYEVVNNTGINIYNRGIEENGVETVEIDEEIKPDKEEEMEQNVNQPETDQTDHTLRSEEELEIMFHPIGTRIM
uniref:Integrase catalytic domain-containing protein n=1 Tax=Chenopodium quinoa TaxID=63459 RepID=A0A803KNI3_CHEQI